MGQESEAVTDLEQGADLLVEVERLNRWERRLQAEMTMPYPVAPIWQVLTDYEGLADFLPNVAVSRRLPHPEGKIRLEQVGMQPLLRLNFRARVVLDIEELYPQRIQFTCVAGDFSRFDGAWHLEPQGAHTRLIYTVQVRPRRHLPVGFIEGRITQGMRLNLRAIRERVAQVWQLVKNAVGEP